MFHHGIVKRTVPVDVTKFVPTFKTGTEEIYISAVKLSISWIKSQK